jgi:eukaryotic-like serine/threonine-protein kinase
MSTQAFGKYQLIKRLAAGGMAEVWLARQTGIEGFNRHVVIKRILPHLAEDPDFVHMFLNEAKIASRLNHPNIGQIYDFGVENGSYFIAMEFIHGEDLGRVMRRAWTSGQWVARHIALRIVADACQGLHYAHSRADEQGRALKVVHRDVSPQNILISFDGAVRIVDFGIAKAADQVSVTKSGAIKGKFAYMAPEQAASKPIDARADIYALGLILYELVTGVRPLKRETELATLQAALAANIEAPSMVAEVPVEIDSVVMGALAKSPDARYRDAREFHTAIEQYLVAHKELATSVQVSELMETLFADRLADERRLGAPNPSTESSTGNPVAESGSLPSVTESPVPSDGPLPSAVETIEEDAVEPSVSRWAPQGTVGPSRRYATVAGADDEARGTRSEERSSPGHAGPARNARDPDQTLKPGPPLRRKAGFERADASGPKRRSTGSKRVAARASPMPQAPPRRAEGAEVLDPADATHDDISRLLDVRAMKERARARLKAAISASMLVGLVVLIVVFREQIIGAVARGSFSSGVPIRLTVTTNPPTFVKVIPPRASGRAPIDLGRTPLSEQSGALVGDSILLVNEDRGIRWEESIELGEPNELKIIEKAFQEVTIKVHSKPKLRDGTIWRGDRRLGNVGVPLAVFPGRHQLEIRSAQLDDPVEFEIVVGDGQIAEKTVDVSQTLRDQKAKQPPE